MAHKQNRQKQSRLNQPSADGALSINALIDVPVSVLLTELVLPRGDSARLRKLLIAGLGDYFRAVEDSQLSDRQLSDRLDPMLQVPFFFGFGVLRVLRDDKLHSDSVHLFCKLALARLNTHVPGGVPYGMLLPIQTLVATAQAEFTLFPHVVALLDFPDPDVPPPYAGWLDGYTIEEALALSALILTQPLPADELAWYGWRLMLASELDAHMTRALADFWLTTDRLPDATRRALCLALLHEQSDFGAPPPIWRYEQAVAHDALATARALRTQYDLLVSDDERAWLAQAGAGADARPHVQAALRMTQPTHTLVPTASKRRAVAGLVTAGADFDAVVDEYWTLGGHSRDDEPLRLGIADAIAAQGAALTDERRRALIERGLTATQAGVRQRFHALAETFYGSEYLARGEQDAASAVRNWVARRLGRRRA